jgi:hypothetical protein
MLPVLCVLLFYYFITLKQLDSKESSKRLDIKLAKCEVFRNSSILVAIPYNSRSLSLIKN